MQPRWPLAFVVLGVFDLILGVVFVLRTRRDLARAIRVPATVVDLRASSDTDGTVLTLNS